MEVAALLRLKAGHACTLDDDRLAVLAASGNLDLALAVDALHLDLGAESGLRERHRLHRDEVDTAALEVIVLGDAHHDMEVAARALALGARLGRRRLAFAGEADHLAVVYAVRDADAELALGRNTPLAAALLALVGDHGASATAIGAGRHHAEHAAETGLRDLALAAAGGALHRLRAGLRARALAGLADIEAPELDLAFAAAERILELDLDLGLEVEAARWPALAAPARLLAEDVVEHREDVVDMHRAEVMAGVLAEPGVTMTVVELATLGVGQHLVRLGARLELDLRVGVVRVAVGMPLHREPPIRPLDVVLRGGLLDRQDLVVAACLRHARSQSDSARDCAGDARSTRASQGFVGNRLDAVSRGEAGNLS